MKQNYNELPNGYLESINRGIRAVQNFRGGISRGKLSREEAITIENHQHLIVEGCYVPFDWRKDFDEDYLASIHFICLAMTDSYIDAHFEEIKDHASDIESRLEDSYCTIDSMKAENWKYIEGFQQAGENIVLINTDYEKAIRAVLEKKDDQ